MLDFVIAVLLGLYFQMASVAQLLGFNYSLP